MLSIIIPSRNEMFLAKTVDDIFNKARGEIEVVVVLDEKDQPLVPRPGLVVVRKEGAPGLRSAINQGIRTAKGEFVMKVDAHCMFGESFDTILTAECESNWVIVPRRYSLNPETWSIRTFRPTIDYEYLIYPIMDKVSATRTGGKWYQKAIDRKDILIDEIIAFQGSCWMAHKQHIIDSEWFSIETSTGDEFVLESEELSFKTWLSGGKCMVNKKTWYAHLHKGRQYGRGYFLSARAMERQREFHMNYWLNNKWPKQIYPVEWLIERFMPMPGWPENWREELERFRARSK